MTDIQAKRHWLRMNWERRPSQFQASQLCALFPKTCKISYRWKLIVRWLPFMRRLAHWHIYHIAMKENV